MQSTIDEPLPAHTRMNRDQAEARQEVRGDPVSEKPNAVVQARYRIREALQNWLLQREMRSVVLPRSLSWRTARLGDLLTLKRGHDLPDSQRQDGDVPVVSSSGITGRHSEAKATAPGVVTGRYGTTGEVFYLEEDFWPLNTALYVVDFKGNRPRFIAYFLEFVLHN